MAKKSRGGIIGAIRTIQKEKKRTGRLKTQIAERNAYNKMQRGRRLKGSESKAVASFIGKGKPRPKYK